ncbi:hydantoinase/oxoprolinase family protein [Kiritimatiellota bacterium B12222]|nr:hydantoinase/oxoprolinase family protein [Kiritimatiellota bacterium B12222]
MQKSEMRIGVDTGGTFTDVIGLVNGELRSWKLPSTPGQFERAVLEGASEVSKGEAARLIHSSTVATNALLERTGARCALITTEGFRDVLELGRQTRPDLYALCPQKPAPLIPRSRRLEIKERVAADGSILTPLDVEALPGLLDQLRDLEVDAVAVVFLFSFLRPEHEQEVGRFLRDAGFQVSLSHEILPVFREYERCSTTVVNAYVQPEMTRYLDLLEAQAEALQLHGLKIMQSNGGILSPQRAGALAVQTLLSGPAAGLQGALELAKASDRVKALNLITFDMGGTSSDVALIQDAPGLTTEICLESFPIGVPMVDVHTVGAGGGSIASVDSGGALQVGPASASAVPGPACYGAGGPPTVTDAHVVLGNIRPQNFLQGRMTLDVDAAVDALTQLGREMGGLTAVQAAEGVLRLVNLHMENAIRVISVQRGFDPALFTLMGFGGAGGLHVFALAEALQIPQVMVPCHPGVLSALGAAVSSMREELGGTVMQKWDKEKTPAFVAQWVCEYKKALRKRFEFPEALVFQLRLEMRYVGQSHELQVSISPDEIAEVPARFHDEHAQRYGHAERDAEVELVTLRVEAEWPAPVCELPILAPRKPEDLPSELDTGVHLRERIRRGDMIVGPALIVEDFHSMLLPKGWRVEADQVGNLLGSKVEGGIYE